MEDQNFLLSCFCLFPDFSFSLSQAFLKLEQGIWHFALLPYYHQSDTYVDFYFTCSCVNAINNHLSQNANMPKAHLLESIDFSTKEAMIIDPVFHESPTVNEREEF